MISLASSVIVEGLQLSHFPPWSASKVGLPYWIRLDEYLALSGASG